MVLSYVVSDAVLLVHCRLGVSLYRLSVEVFLVRLYTGVVAFRDLFFHPVAVSISGFSRWLLGTWPGVEVFFGNRGRPEVPVVVPLKQIMKTGIK